jgi:hypothetical protein
MTPWTREPFAIMKSALLIAGLLGLAQIVFGQERVARYGEASLAFGGSQQSLSLAYHHGWKIGKKQNLEIGTGLRFSSYFSQERHYTTAPAEISKGDTGPFVVFKDDIPANIDSLLIGSPQVNSLNLMITINYRFSPKWQAGFNIDAIGFSFGGTQQTSYINGSPGVGTTASPTTFNLLLVGENDLGSLNSEWYLRYQVNGPWSIKLAYQLLFTEYTTSTQVQTFPEPNDRFRFKSSMLSVGVVYQFGK